ncbi:hypothetical protein AN618_21280 [Fervidicola ferrireducens]|uniref:Uncharacterized protein n=1 Tax=Fervidicola ferrireducens TaxID=520764 RepID=A0A140L2X8_9FIRM|nr:hypothetical protein [Fervidicola ferrireducens]KXG74903.1 hypothetical protein AN618_21280 [Fervidicola ferrireducens]
MSKGLITSQRAAEVLAFLEEVGPSTEEALIIAFGPKTQKALKHLQRAGYAFPIQREGVEFWTAGDKAFDMKSQLSYSWFCARLLESGGRVIDGIAVFPRGQAFKIEVDGDRVFTGQYAFFFEDLIRKPLPECVKRT